MATSIEKQIIDRVKTKLELIRTSIGYETESGTFVFLGNKVMDSTTQLPCCVIFPQYSNSSIEPGSTYERVALPVHIESLSNFDKDADHILLSQKMKADIYECLMSDRILIPYINGRSSTGAPLGQGLTSIMASYSGIIEADNLTSGGWTSNNAAGTLTLRRFSGFDNYAPLTCALSGGGQLSARIGQTGQSREKYITNDMAEEISFTGGGVTTFPTPAQSVIGVAMDFIFRFKILTGNPYSQ
jgi:hypothetical protein